MFRFSLNFSLCSAAALLLRSVPRYSEYNTTVTSFSFFGRLFGSVVGLQCEAEADEDIRERRRRSKNIDTKSASNFGKALDYVVMRHQFVVNLYYRSAFKVLSKWWHSFPSSLW